MSEPGLRHPVHHLDPTAQEFFPSSNLSSVPPPIYYPHPPPPYEIQPVFPSTQPASPPPPFHPVTTMSSRTLLLSMVPSSVSESTVRRELEIFGDVRAVQMERRREGFVTVHFYDVRDAEAALAAIQEQHMQQQFRLGRHYGAVLNNSVALIGVPPPLPPQAARGLISGRVVWAQFITPVTCNLPDGNNQGSLVVFNLDPGVSASTLMEIFGAFGPVKELRETPNKRNQKFVEFYDVRNAAAAIDAVNGQQIHGRTVVIEYSRPGGQYRRQPWKLPSSSTKTNSPSMKNNHSIYTKCSPSPSSMESIPSPTQSLPPPPPRRQNYRWKGNPSGSDSSSGSSSLHGSVSNLCISNGSEESSSSFRRQKPKKQPASYGGCTRPWKGGAAARRGKDHDPRFLINEDAIVESNCRDSRTTVMIKNIPNKYSQKLLLNMLDNHCIHCNEQITGGDDQPLSAYDFVYLPIDFINKCNVGYGFVNMTSPEATLRLYKAFHHQNWEVFNSRKICQVTYARLQGLEALREHFKNSKFPGNAEEYMPVVFSPPRDGRTLTDPIPIIGRDSPPSSMDEDQLELSSEVVNGNDCGIY